MITAIVRYKLPASITKDGCVAHFLKIAEGFGDVDGLIRKQFIWSETGLAGGVYQWHSIEAAKRFYEGPWLSGILSRYGVYPDIEYFKTIAITDNPGGVVTALETPEPTAA
jgi:hypothetical protein